MATAVQKITLSSSRDIPFNKLVLSQSNVRRVKAGVSVDELAESIARRGLIQSLHVRPVLGEDGTETGMFEVPAGGHYNKYFPGHSIAMPKPLSDGQVTYDDGAPQTLEQYSKDVSAFLMWVAEPNLVARKRIGFQVMIFLIVLAGLMYFTKKKVWSDAH